MCLAVASDTAGAADCGSKVEAAFQRLKTSGRPYRIETETDQPAWAQNTERRYWRTVLVDRKTGVLAHEIATPEKHFDKLKSRKHYTHPDGIVIDPPVQ
jgi:hypothetical protein